jgi:TRAP-type C4-dicarboxylate transport system permease large subunit
MRDSCLQGAPISYREGQTYATTQVTPARRGVTRVPAVLHAPILPPGIGLIVYGLVAQVSVGRLFLGGVIPGLLLALGMSITVVVMTVVQITKANLMATFKEVLPFCIACVAVSLVVAYVPATVTWLPDVMMGPC